MSSVEVGKRYYVVVPVADDGAPDDHEINRALGRPDCALDYEISPLDHARVTVLVAGLLTDGREPAALVGCSETGARVVPVAWLAASYPDRRDPLVPVLEGWS